MSKNEEKKEPKLPSGWNTSANVVDLMAKARAEQEKRASRRLARAWLREYEGDNFTIEVKTEPKKKESWLARVLKKAAAYVKA